MYIGIMGSGMGYPIYVPSLKTIGISKCKFENGTWRWLLSYYSINMNNGGGARKNFQKFFGDLYTKFKNTKIYKCADIR